MTYTCYIPDKIDDRGYLRREVLTSQEYTDLAKTLGRTTV